MMRSISYILISLAVVMFASCVKVDIHPVQVDDTAMVSLTLKSTEPVATRADGDAVEDLNENNINSVQCFFSNDGENILFSARKDNLGVTNGIVTNLSLEISSADLAKLSSPCHVFAVVNCDELQIPDDNKTISKLKETTVTLSKTDNSMQESFVMVGTANDLKKADNKLSGTVKVKRVAVKVNVILKVAESIQVKNGDQTETWVPYFDAKDNAFNLTFNGNAKAVLADADIVADTENPSFSSTDSFKVTATQFDGTTQADGNVYTVKMQVPFYTYPMSWADQNDIILQLPWKLVDADENTRFETYEYQIPVQYDAKKLLSNNEYELTVTVGILGNLGTTDLIPSYQVVNWGTGEIDAELSRPEYLVVDQTKVTMNNVETYSVGYSSSYPVKAKVVTNPINKTYNQDPAKYDAVYPLLENPVVVNKTDITFTHALDNTRDDKQYDFRKLTFEVLVWQDIDGDNELDSGELNETITIDQYPAMYLETTESTDYVMINNQTRADGGKWWYVIASPISGIDLFKITVSSFDEHTSEYVICDPREQSDENIEFFYDVNNTGGNTNTLIELAEDAFEDNTLTGYRSTILGESSENLIAPQFIMASSYGAYDGNTHNLDPERGAKYRCATYQEAGYPAGRWRVPTPAELRIMGKLCVEGKITSIFYRNIVYASSNGGYTYNESDGTLNQTTQVPNSIRCVYDTWYWKDKCKKGYEGSFIWAAEGDTDEFDKSEFLESVVK